MKSPIDMISKRFNSLRESEKRVARFIQKNTEEVITLSLQGIADKCSTSDTTVLRFCRSLGYFGFSDFKTSLVTDLLRQGRRTQLEIDPSLKPENKKNIFLQNFRMQLDSTVSHCDYEVITMVAQKISEADKIIVIGLGGSAGVAHIFCDSINNLGIFCSSLIDPSIIHNLVHLLTEKDVLIGISHSGETEEIVSAVRMANENHVFTVGITNFSPSPLVDITEIALITSIPDTTLESYSCQSRISQLAVLEMILHELSDKLAKNKYNKRNHH